MKTYQISYIVKIYSEATVQAKTKEQAIKKVKEVIGEPVEIEDIIELGTR